ncbi:MAG TPA: dienelactone hydrolase family protein [Candidatus Limnocylindrales bacterium]
MSGDAYDPFTRGPFPVGVLILQAHDAARDRLFPVEIRYPGRLSGPHPLVLYSHRSGGDRRSATFLTTHLASHGYAVAALDHSEVVVPELGPNPGQTDEQRAARLEAIISSRVPDLRFLLDHLLNEPSPPVELDADRIGLVGHSLGGWTVLATAQADARVRTVVAHTPGGGANPRPGVLNLPLSFESGRDVPTLFLAAELDVPIPPEAVEDVHGRAPAPKRLVTLKRADHQHFVDDVEGAHEAARAMPLPPAAAWMQAEMRPIVELCDGESAHRFVRGLTLSHLDATLRADPGAVQLLDGDIEKELAARGIDAVAHAGR